MEIEIFPGNEHGPRLISANHENDLFHDAFLQADAALKEIRKITEKYENDKKECELNPRKNPSAEELLYCFGNNRIAFCGNRGQGKTSAMLSFAQNLGNDDKIGKNFLVLPTIDPTMLEPKDSILSVILARMFQKVREIWEDERNCGRKHGEIIRQELTECFQFCMEGIAVINSRKGQPSDEFSSLDQLEQLGDSTTLRKNFLRLVKKLLQFSRRSDETGYIIIPLDDTDLQFQTAYNILEDLRKYLSIPHVVLLMALHLDQMRDLVEKQYAAYFSPKNIDDQDIRLKASRYIDKMFPASHVIFLPQFAHFCRDSYRTLKLSYGDNIIPKGPLQEGVLRYIYEKTGLLFVVPSKYLHNMIPDTLRGLSQLLNLLFAMEDIPKAKQKTAFITEKTISELHDRATIALRNLQMFENYFLHEWCVGELTPKHAAVLESASQVALSIQIPKLYHDIAAEYSDVVQEGTRRNKGEKMEATSKANGQTMYSRLLNLLDGIASNRDAKTYHFCFAVHTYIMLQLHKTVWWVRAEAKVTSTGPLEKDEAIPVSILSYPQLVEILEGTLWWSAKEQRFQDIKPLSDIPSIVKNSKELELLARTIGEQYYYDYTRPLCSVLLQDIGKLQNAETDEESVYSWQEASLMIVLNWDIQEQMRNLDILKDGIKSPYEMYDKLKQRLKEKQVDKIVHDNTDTVLDGILSFWDYLKSSDAYRQIFDPEGKMEVTQKKEIQEVSGDTSTEEVQSPMKAIEQQGKRRNK